MTLDGKPAPQPKARPWRFLLPLLLMGLAVYLLLPQLATFEHSLQVMRSMKWWAVGLAVAMQIVSYLGGGYLLGALVATVGDRLTVVRGTLITTAAYSVGLVAGGMVGSLAATYGWVHGSGVGMEGALLAGWLPGLLFDAALLLAAVVGLLYLLIVHELTLLQVVSFAFILSILTVVAVGVVWGTRHRSWLTDLAVKVSRRWANLRRRAYDPAGAQASVGRLFSAWDRLRSGGWHRPALGVAINTVFDMLTLYWIFVAAGHTVSPGVLLAGYGLPLLLGKTPLLPGGVGIVEGTMAALYTSLGVPGAVTVVVILVYRFLSFWLPSLLGFPLIPYLHHVCTQAGPLPAENPSRRGVQHTIGHEPRE
jgi:uncharacterized protein (TIRG00374 family)